MTPPFVLFLSGALRKYRTRRIMCRVLQYSSLVWLILIVVFRFCTEVWTSNMWDIKGPIQNTFHLLPKQKIDRYIFQIGFNKCGTTSLYAFMVDNGIPSIHNTPCSFDPKEVIRSPNEIYFNKMLKDNWDHNRSLLNPECSDYFQFYSDFGHEVAGERYTIKRAVLEHAKDNSTWLATRRYNVYIKMWYSRLQKQYPQSLFILNIRDINHWLKSKYRHRAPYHTQYRFNRNRESINQIIDEMAIDHDHVTDVDILQILRRSWYLYICNAIDYFGENDIAAQLLLFNVESDPVQKLTDFFIRFGIKLDPKYWGQNNKSGARQKEQYIMMADQLQEKRWKEIERQYPEFSTERKDNKTEYERITRECINILGQEKWSTLSIVDDGLL